jgi:hypothetical protein
MTTPLSLFVLITARMPTPPPVDAGEIVARMVEADNLRMAKLAGYTGIRRYRLENQRFHKSAQMTVRATYDEGSTKRFEIIAEEGSKVILRRVLRPMLEAESEGSRKGERDNSRFLPANYEFELIGAEPCDGSTCYVLEVTPKTKNKYLIRGRIWVRADEHAVIRVEGGPARNPSFWTRRIRIQHRYSKLGAFWLPVANSSAADVRIFGRTEVTIEYFDYTVREEHSNTNAESRDGGRSNAATEDPGR